jgi:UDPglucose 6-dehydrogenase
VSEKLEIAWIESPEVAMNVVVLGTGHVGLITSVTMAVLGHNVVGVDVDKGKIERLREGLSPFYEPDVEGLLVRAMSEGRLSFTTDSQEAIAAADVAFICVGTPARANGEANLVAVEQAARDVARSATSKTIVVDKSTVPAGTANQVKRVLMNERPDLEGAFEVVSNPEFLREGNAMYDSLFPDRILIGAESADAFEVMKRLYRSIVDRGSLLIETDISTAELAKHACNAFLAMKISYINGLAQMCERTGADVVDVAKVMGSDPRIGPHFLDAGLGYGGYCFPKDLIAFESLADKLGYTFPLLRAVAKINEDAIESAVTKIRDLLWNLEDKRVSLLGLSFKPDTDDVRFSPALALASRLLQEGATVVGYDPCAAVNARAEVPGMEVVEDPYEAVANAHCVVLCTEWDELTSLDLARIRDLMIYPILIDGRNAFDADAVTAAGLHYHPTGRSSVPAMQVDRSLSP